MAINAYTVSLFVHISSVFLWIATIPIATIVDRVVHKIEEKVKQFSVLRMAEVNSKISAVAAVLVVVTGSIMVEIGNWGWAPGPGVNWLIAKQTIWLILLIGSILLMRPATTKLDQLIKEDAPFEQAYNVFLLLKRRGHMLTGLVVVNIFLATTKPF